MKNSQYTPEERRTMATEIRLLRMARKMPELYKREEIKIKTERDVVKDEGRY